MPESEATIIQQLRVRTHEPDYLAVRSRLQQALALAVLNPIGLPREAVLFVRRLTTRAANRNWPQQAAAQLEGIWHAAVRPIDGAAPANAQAVLFANRAELLACLAMDWCAGDALTHWWWKGLLRQRSVEHAVVTTWLESPQHIPAALHQLAIRYQIEPFIQKLDAAAVQALTLTITHTFGLRAVHTIIQDHPASSEAAPEAALESSSLIMNAPDALDGLPGAFVVPAWLAYVPEMISANLTPDRQLLIGLGVTLHRAPHLARSIVFAQQIERWHRAVNAAPIHIEIHLPDEALPLDEAPPPGDTRRDMPATLTTLAAPAVQPEHNADQAALQVHSNAAAENPSLPSIAPLLPIDRSDEITTTTRPTLIDQLDGIEVITDLGGCLYLINLGLFLGLYGDFTTPLSPGIDLPIWDFVGLIALDLIGAEVLVDPLWALLAQLAGRADDELPGHDFAPPDGSTPSVWLAALRARLRTAINTTDEELPRFFRAHAHVVVSDLRLAVHLVLAELPIAIRLSGLDRDPGWVPAAGRTIAFYFD